MKPAEERQQHGALDLRHACLPARCRTRADVDVEHRAEVLERRECVVVQVHRRRRSKRMDQRVQAQAVAPQGLGEFRGREAERCQGRLRGDIDTEPKGASSAHLFVKSVTDPAQLHQRGAPLPFCSAKMAQRAAGGPQSPPLDP